VIEGTALGLKIDLHVHTCYSTDSSITLKDAVKYAKKCGLDGIAVTDHNTVEGAKKLKTKDIIIVPGIEISTLNGHLLGLNVTTQIPARLPMEESIRLVRDAGGIAVAPHPTAFYKSPPSRKVSSYDAVEVMNASSVPFSILTHYSRKFARRLGLPETGGSDSHYAPEIGSAYTVVDSGCDVDEIVSAIKKGATVAVGHGVPWGLRLKRSMVRLKRKF
jgi:predicted metal-dependent phosphoesterase TrpH